MRGRQSPVDWQAAAPTTAYQPTTDFSPRGRNAADNGLLLNCYHFKTIFVAVPRVPQAKDFFSCASSCASSPSNSQAPPQTLSTIKDMRSSSATSAHPKPRGTFSKSSSIDNNLSTLERKKAATVKRDAAETDGRVADSVIAARMTVDRLYAERVGRLADFESLKRTVRELVADASTEDRGTLREHLVDVQAQWNALMDRLMAVVASLVSFFIII